MLGWTAAAFRHFDWRALWLCNHWMNAVVLDDGVGIDAFELARRLASRGIETRPFFKGMHEQPALKSLGLFQDLRLPVTERLYRRDLYLPSGNTLSDAQIETVAFAVRTSIEEGSG